MIDITKGAREALDMEIAHYKDYLINRASNYANQNKALEIKSEHIHKAAEEFRNDFYSSSGNYINKKTRINYSSFILIISLLLIAFIPLPFFILNLNANINKDELLLIVSLMAAIMGMMITVATLVFSKKQRVTLKMTNNESIVKFLNKWNEVESLLRNLYKKYNKQDSKNIKELIQFYQELPVIQEKGMADVIIRLLITRNNIRIFIRLG